MVETYDLYDNFNMIKENKLENLEEKELQDFIQKIVEIKEGDLERGKERGLKYAFPANFSDIDPQELIIEDARIWAKVNDKSITPEDLKEYVQSFKDQEGNFKKEISESRKNFIAFVNNKVTPLFVRRKLN